jgi:hypothetical protein
MSWASGERSDSKGDIDIPWKSGSGLVEFVSFWYWGCLATRRRRRASSIMACAVGERSDSVEMLEVSAGWVRRKAFELSYGGRRVARASAESSIMMAERTREQEAENTRVFGGEGFRI